MRASAAHTHTHTHVTTRHIPISVRPLHRRMKTPLHWFTTMGFWRSRSRRDKSLHWVRRQLSSPHAQLCSNPLPARILVMTRISVFVMTPTLSPPSNPEAVQPVQAESQYFLLSLPLPFWHRCRKLCFEARPVRSPVYFRITSRGASHGFLSPRICKRRHMNLGQLLKFRYGACSACQPLVLLPPPQALYKLGRDNGSQRRSGTWIVKTGRLIKPNEVPFPHQRSHRRCRASCPCSLMMLARPLFNELHSCCFLRGHVACLDRERHLPSQHMGDAGPSKKRD